MIYSSQIGKISVLWWLFEIVSENHTRTLHSFEQKATSIRITGAGNMLKYCLLYFWRFSLTKPLVLPGVDKKALANNKAFMFLSWWFADTSTDYKKALYGTNIALQSCTMQDRKVWPVYRLQCYRCNDTVQRPLGGQQAMTLIGSEQTTSSLVVMIYILRKRPKQKLLLADWKSHQPIQGGCNYIATAK